MKILTTPNQFLRKTAKKVQVITSKNLIEIKEMIATLKAASNPQGVGLAATQVGIDKQIFVLISGKKPEIFINPKITNISKKKFSDIYKKDKDRWLEGCLSIPKIWGFVDRPFEVELEYQTFNYQTQDPNLKTITKKFSDIESAYVQHETDHLNGILFTDHVLKQRGQLYQEIDGDLEPISIV